MASGNPIPRQTARDRWDERRRWQRISKADQELIMRALNGRLQQRQLTLDDDRRRAA